MHVQAKHLQQVAVLSGLRKNLRATLEPVFFLSLVGMSTVDRDVVNGQKRAGSKTGRRKERTKICRMHEGAALT